MQSRLEENNKRKIKVKVEIKEVVFVYPLGIDLSSNQLDGVCN